MGTPTGSSRLRSASSFTPKPMWRCSSAAMFSMPCAERRQLVAFLEVAADEVLARLRERRLDHDVVERHRRRELGAASGRRAARRPSCRGGRRSCGSPTVSCGLIACRPLGHRAVADAADLLHEALEEDRVAGLVDLLGGEEVLLLLQRRGVDVGGEVVGDRVLAPEEQAVVPQRRLALELGEVLAPLARVLGEVELGGRPVAALPARVQVLVGDRVGGQARRRRWRRSGSTCVALAIVRRS